MKRWSLPAVTLVVGLVAGGFLAGTFTLGQNNPPPVNAVPIPKEFASFRDVVKRILPAVVSVEGHPKVAQVGNPAPFQGPGQVPFGDPRVPEEYRRFFKEFRGPGPGPDQDLPRGGFGSGFLVDSSGVVVTNCHVVDNTDHVTVQLKDGRKFTSKNVRCDRRSDLAVILLDVKNEKLPYLELGDSDAMEIGDRVLAVGAPFGLAGSVTHGIISAKGRNGLHMNMYEDFLQTDAAINPGNSGGPLVSLDGKVVGINAAIKTRSGGFQGVGLAVASNLAKNVVQALRTDGVVHRGYLGVQIRELTPEVAQRLGVAKGTGVVVSNVFDKTPAEKAGLKPGDVVTKINGKPVPDGQVLQRTIAGLPIGKAASFELVRDGKVQTVDVTIEEQPAEFGTANAPAPRGPALNAQAVPLGKVGVEVADMTGAMAEDLGYGAGTTGVVVTRVEPGSLGAEAGLRRGMLITKIDSQAVATAAAARQALDGASLPKGVLMQVQSPTGGLNFILLKQAGGE